MGARFGAGEVNTLQAYKDRIQQDPAIHHKVGDVGQIYDPEICFTVQYHADENNRAYTLQDTGEGACYVSHPVDVLPFGIRWISRTGDEDSMGMILPATAEIGGYTCEKKKGLVKLLPGNGKLRFSIEAGWLEPEQVKEVRAKIASLVSEK